MKKKMSELSEQERIKTLDTLYTAASGVRGRDGMKQFLKGLLTESERVMLGRRIIIARLLLQGADYREIAERLGAGHATIRMVEHWLSGQLPGYESAIQEAEKEFGKREFKKKYATSMLFRLKKRYPLHFLLFPEPK
ncbi:MAG: hypothetical protein KGI41_02175 [Patescibacteria group bacterium]|nr:hypothetical protein [Patescibacteria group bacterium]MDE1966020.1 hypothetical protein [Patescibacteria group bacterium]